MLPHIVVIPPEFNIQISAIDVKSVTPPKCFDLLFISAEQGMFRYWQVMLSLKAVETGTTSG
jgi:hypothetical protein